MSFLEFQKKQPMHEFQLFQNTIKYFIAIMLETSDDVKVDYSVEIQGLEINIHTPFFSAFAISGSAVGVDSHVGQDGFC